MKYPIGIQSFESIRKGGYVYVDKTDYVYKLADEGLVYFLSRPRRFGKSLLLSTLKCYFLGRKELFEGLKIAELEKEWAVYPVLHLDFNGQDYSQTDALTNAIDTFLARAEREYGRDEIGKSLSDRFLNVIRAAYEKTGRKAVVLIDEYDKPLLDVMDQPYKVEVSGTTISLEEYNHNILKSFYATLKTADEYLKFVMLTGVTKFSQVSVFSGFNQPKDISLSTQYEALCGINEEELEYYFHESIEHIAKKNGIAYKEMKAKLKATYDGYHFSSRMTGIYNPFSLFTALSEGEIKNYWFRTGTPTYLVRILENFDQNIDELLDYAYDEDEFASYKADAERPLPMIYQSGYLTIKDYDSDTGAYKLDFPNTEVKQGFLAILANSYLKPDKSVTPWILKSVENLKNGKLDDFRKSLTAFLASIPYSMRRKENERERERYFHYTFYLILRLLSTYLTYTEKEQSEGRVDCIIETTRYVFIFEFKLDGTASEALKQIEEKGYVREYADDNRTIYKVGCSFSSETGTVDEWKVQQ